MTYEETINYLYESAPLFQNIGANAYKEGLYNTYVLDEHFGHPHTKYKTIHIAGTNGKGSCAHMLAAVLQSCGYKTGLYTSPHLVDFRERIRINGKMIPKHEVIDFLEKERSFFEPLHPSFFELTTALAFYYFAKENVDIAVIEVGLGGRLDCTNIINSTLSIITNISFDHMALLGNTLEKIAYEKAGIIKPNCPVVTSEGYEAIKDAADEQNSLLLFTAPFADTTNLSLKGTYQQENLALALTALKLVFPEISQSIVDEGLKKVKHPCRFQVIEDKNLIIDGAHNPNGITGLRESLDYYYPDKYRRFVFGCLRNKDYKKMMEILFEQGDEIYFYHFNNKNSCTVEELQTACQFPSKEFKSLTELPQKENTMTIVCGSFYMLQEIIKNNL